MVERGIARDAYPVLSLEGQPIGQITSGSPSPFLKTNIAFALVPTAVAASGEDVLVQIDPPRPPLRPGPHAFLQHQTLSPGVFPTPTPLSLSPLVPSLRILPFPP